MLFVHFITWPDAALGLDEDGGRAVNLLPSDSPQDVYTRVLEGVLEQVMVYPLCISINISLTVNTYYMFSRSFSCVRTRRSLRMTL